MEKYSLEISNWGSYELVKDFSSMSGAIRHGQNHYPQNDWRVFDRVGGSVVYENDPFASIEEQASQEISRFQNTELWRRRFQEQAERDVRARQEWERMAEIARRQRQSQTVRDFSQERRDRLEGFNFIGGRPAILEDEDWTEYWPDEDERLDLSTEPVNWLIEGF